jgi:multiple sugar transport system ATP-binding protein
MAEVTFDGVTKRFGDVTALSGLSLHVTDGEFMVLVGPSGSGKTTALRLLAGLEALTSGDLRIGDRQVNRVAPKDRDIAMVFQDYALYPQMTVEQNLAFGLRMRKLPKDEIARRVHEAAETLGIQDLLGRKPRALSGGQRQRVALGRALVREPHVFLMDEPLSNLDAKLRVQTRSEIKRIQHEVGTTTVYVTHDQVEAMTMGDRVAVMNDGVLEQVDEPTAIYERPANTFVAGFVGSPSMSLVPMSVRRTNGSVVLTQGELAIETRSPGAIPDEVVVGVRPEHARIWTEDPELLGPIEGRVEYVEMLGRESFVGVTPVDDASFIVLVEPHARIRPGDALRFGVERGRVYVFDPVTQQALGTL